MSANAKQQPEEQKNLWLEYERRKAQIPQDMSQEERDVEIKRIADELGI